MKPLTYVFAAIAALSPLVTSAADFEGVVKMNMTGQREQAIPMTFNIKPGLTRIDFEAGPGHTASAIMNAGKQEVLILMPEQKMYMVQPLSGAGGPAEVANQQMADSKIEKTNDHEKILGYNTTKYIVQGKEGTSQIWMTDELGTFMGLGAGQSGPFGGRRPNRGGGQSWEELFKGKQAFPLRVVTTSSDGKQTFKMEATSIDKKSLPDSLFQPPADFQKFDMGAMMQGMGMPGGMRPHRNNQSGE